MHDQADQLRKLVHATIQVDSSLAPGGPIVALSGGKPGVGVTTTACGLARELARLGKQVIAVDANLRQPQATELLGAGAAVGAGSLAAVLSGQRRAAEVLQPTAVEGVRIIPGCRPDHAPPLDRASLARLAAELASLSQQADVVVIDAGQGMNAWIDSLWQLARLVLLVATPDPQALLDAYAAVKAAQFHRLDGRLRLLVNRADDAEARALAGRFAETCQRFLFVSPQSAASLPEIPRPRGGASVLTADGDDPAHTRALRLLAADVAGDFRATSLRLLRPTPAINCPRPTNNRPRDVSQRR